jgi:hypothetical protein
MYQKNTKPETELPEWDRAALAYAKSRPRDDGTIGVVLKKGPAAEDWIAYFKWVGMGSRASFFRHHTETGGSITVPTEYPHQYDPTFRVGRVDRSHARNRETGKATNEKKEPLDRTRWWDR